MAETPWLKAITHNDGGTNDMATDSISTELWEDGGVLDQITALANALQWEEGDEIVVKIAGSRVSGIHQTEEANPKWSPPFGDIRHNRDAQIVIENLSRRDLTKSKPLQQSELPSGVPDNDGGGVSEANKLG